MSKLTVNDIDTQGKRVLVRVDFNVPMMDGQIADDTRIREALPTIRYLIEQEAKIVLITHLGRPKGHIRSELRLDPVAARLSELLGQSVTKIDSCVGDEAIAAAEALQPGEVLLLENVRFYPEEMENGAAFAAELACLGEVFVQEAFGVVHRDQASVTGVAQHLPTVAGLLVKKEIGELSKLFDNPQKPLVLVLGGAKIDTKIGILKQFIPLADTILLGGGLANTFLAATGHPVGDSLCERDKLDFARELLAEAKAAGCDVVLPTDAVCAAAGFKPDDDTPSTVTTIDDVAFDQKIYDLGPASAARYAEIIQSAGTVVWNGPVGYFEKKPFSSGTRAIADACLAAPGMTLLGGGDTITALQQFDIPTEKYTHVSTGGGAMLEFLEGKTLPGLAAIAE